MLGEPKELDGPESAPPASPPPELPAPLDPPLPPLPDARFADAVEPLPGALPFVDPVPAVPKSPVVPPGDPF